MKKLCTALICLLLVIPLSGLTGCGGLLPGGSGLKYDEYSTDYDPNVNSWEQIDPDDEDVEITWFTNYTFYVSNFEDLIYRRTGVRIKFQSAMTSDNEEMNTMIAGNKLPDVITIGDLNTRVQLAEEGYVYAIDRLAESYAPSMLSRIPEDHKRYYVASDGYMYGLASNYYSDEDISSYEDDLGGHYFMNYDVVVRKDYLNAYINYRKGLDASFDADAVITKPAGFLDMCKWVKETYSLPNNNPTVIFSPFNLTATNDCFNYSLSALMELFCVPYEDEEGNYVYQYDTPEFVEVMKFINDLYNNNLLISSNFSYDRNDISTHLLNGRPFAYIGASQQHVAQLRLREQDGYDPATDTIAEDHEYVSIVLTNSNGDAPLLCDYAGRGLYVTMITNNCKRPDRVIKVMDYMLSEQGQREMYYGETEGEFYTYAVRPGEIDPETGKVSPYGRMKWTDKAVEEMQKDNPSALYTLGFTRTTMLTNLTYTKLTSMDKYGINWLQTWLEFKNKCTYFDYAFSRVPFRYPLDTSDQKTLNEYTDRQADIEAIWIEAYPKMIMAANHEAMMAIYQDALTRSYSAGAEEWRQYRDRCFKAYKQELGIDYAWPAADPDYEEPAVTLFGSHDKYMIDRPEQIKYGN